jgi:hypothetical protein
MKISSVFATALSSCSMIAITAFGFSTQAPAFTISGQAVGIWENPVPDKNNTFCSNSNTNCKFVEGVGTNSFSWGEPAANTTPYKANNLTFTGNSFSANVGSWFKLGSLNYFNGIIYADTNIEHIDLKLNLSFGNNNEVGKLLSIPFYLENTTNTAENIKDPQNADHIHINTATAKTSFELDQILYQFEIAGFSPSLSSPVTKISALEGEQADSPNYLYARVTSLSRTDSIPPRRDVPEPGTLAASLVAGGYLIYRKKFSKIKPTSSCK